MILGGDDQTDHGHVDSSGNSQLGWLYIEKAIGNIKPKVGRANDNFIAAFGSEDPGVVDTNSGGDAGAAIKNAGAKNGMGVQFFDTPAEIASGFDAIRSGAIRPAIIWVAGDQAGNDLSACEGPESDGEAVSSNASVINDFVNQGGGLMSHGTCYAWLATLLPGLQSVPPGGPGDDLYLTPAGQAAFPGLSESDIQSDAWHNFFDGNLGGLDVLVRSKQVPDSTGADAPVVIGGGQVSLTEKPTDLGITQSAKVGGNSLVYTIVVTNHGPNPASGVNVTSNLPVVARDASAGQGSCSGVGTTTVNCALGDLAVGQSVTITITVRPRSSGTMVNTVSVSGNQPDTNSANNSATDRRSFTVRRAARRDRTRPRVTVAGVAGTGNSCVRSGFSVRFRIREPRLRAVSVFLDGRRVMRTTRKVFRVRVNATRLRSGRHALRAVAVDRAGNRRVVRRAFNRCARPAAVPHFTG